GLLPIVAAPLFSLLPAPGASAVMVGGCILGGDHVRGGGARLAGWSDAAGLGKDVLVRVLRPCSSIRPGGGGAGVVGLDGRWPGFAPAVIPTGRVPGGNGFATVRTLVVVSRLHGSPLVCRAERRPLVMCVPVSAGSIRIDCPRRR